MMKKLLVGFIFLSLVGNVNGQGETALPAGNKQLSFGLPGYVGLDFAITDMVTLGPRAQLGIFDSNNHFSLGIVSDFHFNTLMDIPGNWDFYAGLNAGYRIYEDSGESSDFGFGGQIGGRWFWSNEWGLHLEGGWSTSIAGGIGVTWRM